jgi:hypothetical protein
LPENPKSMWNMEKYADNATYVMRENAHITFLKGYDAGYPKKFKISINSCFEIFFNGFSIKGWLLDFHLIG